MEEVKNIAENANMAAEQAENTAAVAVVTESDTKETGYVHVLKQPFDYCGIKYTKFSFDFEKLVGEDMVAIEKEMADNGEYVLSPEISTGFLARMAAKAAGVGSDVILKLPIRDFGKIKNESRNFLLSTGY